MTWPKVKIGDVADVLPGFAFKSKDLGEEGTSIIKIGNIKEDGSVDVLNCQRLPKNLYSKSHDKFKLRNGDVVIAMTGATAGKVGRIRAAEDEEFLLNQRVAKFLPRSINTDFLWFAIGNDKYRAKFFGLGGGAAQPNMSGPQIAAVEIPFPDRAAQERIASILSAYDELIENNRRRIVLLEQAARMIYREWFVHFRFPGHETTTVVDGLPDGWEIKTFAEVCQTIGGGTPSTKVSSYWDDGDIPWITPTDITRNDCLALLDGEKKITREGLGNSSAKMVPPHTILMTSRASVGFFGLADKEVCTNQGFINIVPDDELMRYYALFNLLHRVEEIRSHASGSTYAEISKSKFRALPIVQPANDVLEAFDQNVRPMIEQVRVLKKTTQKLTKARDFLLPRLMDGRIPV